MILFLVPPAVPGLTRILEGWVIFEVLGIFLGAMGVFITEGLFGKTEFVLLNIIEGLIWLGFTAVKSGLSRSGLKIPES